MKRFALLPVLAGSAFPAVAQESRQLDAHVHGETVMQIAVENDRVEISIMAPGMDVVGFEHPPEQQEDRQAVAAALTMLETSETVFKMPEAAGCSVQSAEAELHLGGATPDHESHDHDDHGHEGHDDHGHEDHDEHGHEDEGHEDHGHGGHDEHEAGHSAFHADYALECASPDRLTGITLTWFESFPATQTLDVAYVTDAGVGAVELTRDDATLTFD